MDPRAAVTLTPPADRKRSKIGQNVDKIKSKSFYSKLSQKRLILSIKKKERIEDLTPNVLINDFYNDMYLNSIKP